MKNSSRLAGSRWFWGVFLMGVLSGSGYVAREQGWLDSFSWFKQARVSRHSATFDGNDDVPGPDDPSDFELSPSTLLAQSEPDEPAPGLESDDVFSISPKRSVRQSRFAGSDRPRLDFDEETGNSDPGDARSRIANVGFEEEAPVAPPVSKANAGRSSVPSTATKPSVAGRPTESTKAVSTSRNEEVGPVKALPLMDRKDIEKLVEKGDYVEAQKELSQWYWQKPAEREKVTPQLNKLAQALYFSPQPQYYEPYVVKPGDQLRVVGQRYKLSWEYIAKLNHVDARKIRMGQKLKIVPGPFAAIIFIDRYELVVHLNGSFVKSYRVGVGKDGTTPVGTFTVKNKMTDPTYYGPEGVIAHDDPNNPLGERWIDIGDSYGIHGTIDPQSIGKSESRGCIRMLNSEVEEVYDFLVIGSEVKIQ